MPEVPKDVKLTKEDVLDCIQALDDKTPELLLDDPDLLRDLCDLAFLGLSRQWRPIAEAPKDGCIVLVGYPGKNGYVKTARWEESLGAYGLNSNWHDTYRRKILTPTHYQPLPSPPEVG